MVFDFAGIIADEKGSRWKLLDRLVVSGGILSVCVNEWPSP